MSAWSNKPPTYKEWIDAKNHGCWWVKYLLVSAHTEEIDGKTYYYGEAWFTEIVTLTCSHEKGQLFGGDGKLHASGLLLREVDLDDVEGTKDMYWQQVVPPMDDVKDERPKC